MKPNHAIILAAGMGTRFSESTGSEVPKPLYPLNGQPLIEYSIQNLRANGVEFIHIGCGFHMEDFTYLKQKYKNINLVYNPYFDTRSSLYTLEMFKDIVHEATWLLEGDLLYEAKALELPMDQFKGKSIILTSKALEVDDNVYFSADNGQLLELSKTLDLLKRQGVMTGIWLLEPGILNDFSAYCTLQPNAYTQDYEVILAQFSKDAYPIQIFQNDQFSWCEIDHDDHLTYAIEQVLPKLL